MIEELAARVFATRNAAHAAHWAAKGSGSFARHTALGGIYDALPGKIDAIVEVYQGAFGLIGELPEIEPIKRDDIIAHIGDEAEWINANRDKIAQGIRALQNLIDDLAGEYLRAFYKLENLK